MVKKHYETLGFIIAFAAICYYCLFHKLGYLPFRIWDESRLATSAYEMAHSKNWLVPTFNNQPDMWSTKPPMMIWAQAICIKIYHLSEVAIRLPSALCALLTAIAITLFVYNITRSRLIGLFSGVVLCTASGYTHYHAARFGEYDGMLTLFTSAYLISFFKYTERLDDSKNTYIILFFVFLTCAALTKGVAAMLFTPPLFVYLLFRKKLSSTLGNKYFYIGLLLFIIFVAGYYLLRNHYNPGYISAVVENELGGRFNQVLEGHDGPWNYYLHFLAYVGFGPWYWILPTSIIFIWFSLSPVVKRAMIFMVLNALFFIAVLSSGKTKLFWYLLPSYPIFAILAGLIVSEFSEIISSIRIINKEAFVWVLFIVLSAQPVWEQYNRIAKDEDLLSSDDFYAPSYFIRDALTGKRNLNNCILIENTYSPQLMLYITRLKERRVHISTALPSERIFAKGEKLIAYQPDNRNYIESNYDFEVIDQFYNVREYIITGIKKK